MERDFWPRPGDRRTDDIDARERRAQTMERAASGGAISDRATRVVRLGDPAGGAQDVYHFLMTSPWWQFLGTIFGTYLCVNLGFASAFYAVRHDIINLDTYVDAFFFSVQTMASIGYGHIVPIGFWPNAIMTIEAFVGMLSVSVGAGLFFARLTRPEAGVLFSERAVVGVHDGVPMLMFRLANKRRAHIVDAHVYVVMGYDDRTEEGEFTRRLIDLDLRRDTSPSFILSWTVRHVIDETSPLFGRSPEDLAAARAEVMVVFTGFHESFNQTVHARRAYGVRDIHWNHRLVDIFTTIDDGRTALDFTKFHNTEPLEAEGPGSAPPTSRL